MDRRLRIRVNWISGSFILFLLNDKIDSLKFVSNFQSYGHGGNGNGSGNSSHPHTIRSCRDDLIQNHFWKFGHTYCSHVCGHVRPNNTNTTPTTTTTSRPPPTYSNSDTSQDQPHPVEYGYGPITLRNHSYSGSTAFCHPSGHCMCQRGCDQNNYFNLNFNASFDGRLCHSTTNFSDSDSAGGGSRSRVDKLRCKLTCALHCPLGSSALCEETTLLGPQNDTSASICVCDCPLTLNDHSHSCRGPVVNSAVVYSAVFSIKKLAFGVGGSICLLLFLLLARVFGAFGFGFGFGQNLLNILLRAGLGFAVGQRLPNALALANLNFNDPELLALLALGLGLGGGGGGGGFAGGGGGGGGGFGQGPPPLPPPPPPPPTAFFINPNSFQNFQVIQNGSHYNY